MIPLICAIFNRRTIEVSIVKKVSCAKTTRNETFINLANCYLKHCCDDVKKHILWRHAAKNLHMETTIKHLVELFANQFPVQVIFFCCFRVLSLLLHSTLHDIDKNFNRVVRKVSKFHGKFVIEFKAKELQSLISYFLHVETSSRKRSDRSDRDKQSNWNISHANEIQLLILSLSEITSGNFMSV